MYFDQGNIQCWKDQCEKQRKELTELNAQLADQREDRRFQAACAAMHARGLVEYHTWEDLAADCVKAADALLKELEKKETE